MRNQWHFVIFFIKKNLKNTRTVTGLHFFKQNMYTQVIKKALKPMTFYLFFIKAKCIFYHLCHLFSVKTDKYAHASDKK